MAAFAQQIGSAYYSFDNYSGFPAVAGCEGRNSLETFLEEAGRCNFNSFAQQIGSAYYAFGNHSGFSTAAARDSRNGPETYLDEVGRSCGPYEAGTIGRPFVHFVVKVASRCNIKCSYCYMYESADQTWRGMPRRMSDETEAALVDRIIDYLPAHRLSDALVILHGGEPLLYGPERIDRFGERIRLASERHEFEVGLAMQTNATMIDDANLEVLIRHRVGVGVSLDGPAAVHDAARRDKRGRGTYERVTAGLRRLLAATADGLPPPAVTAVVDPAARPRELIEQFLDLGVEYLDFQLPDLNHDTYPHERWSPGTFGSWLIELYDELWRLDRPLRVRSIELLIRLLMGAPYGGDILGLRSFGTLVIDTDGSYHAHDSLKATFDGATATGRSVRTDAISSLEGHPMVLAFTDKASAAAETCRRCPLFPVCGGGLVAHRYSADRGFDNPSVYCADLAMFIRHVDRSVQRWHRAHDPVRQ